MRNNIKKQNKKIEVKENKISSNSIKVKKVNRVSKKTSIKNQDENAIKKILALCLVAFVSINAFAAIVSSNDGSSFVTKSEFDAMKDGLSNQIDDYKKRVAENVDGAIATYLNNSNITAGYDPDEQTIKNDSGTLKVNPGGLLTLHIRGDQIAGNTESATSGVHKFVTSENLYNNILSIAGVPIKTTVSNQIWTSGVNGAGAWKGLITTLSSATSDNDIPSAKLLKTSIDTKVDKTTTVNGHALSGNVTVTKSDVGLGSVVNTGDSATPISGGTTKFTTGGAYTELAKKQNKLPTSTTANQIYASTTTSGTYALKTVGNGLTINSSGVLGHSNNVTAQTGGIGSATSAISGLKYDSAGHITGVTTATMYPPTTGQASNYYWRGNGTGVVGTWQAAATSVSSGGTGLVTSGAVWTALDAKQKKLPTSTTANQIFATTTTSGTYALKTVGNGLTINGSNVLGHSISTITKETTGKGSANAAINSLKYDEYGHITSVSTTAMYPPTDKGTSGYVWTSNGASTNPSWQAIPCPYPVGYIYIGIGSEDPGSIWLGTSWDSLGTGRCLWNTESGGGGNIEEGLPDIRGSLILKEAHGKPLGIRKKYWDDTGVFTSSNPKNIENPDEGGDRGGSGIDTATRFHSDGLYTGSSVQPPSIYVHMWKRTG